MGLEDDEEIPFKSVPFSGGDDNLPGGKILFFQIPAQVVTLPNHLIRTRHLMAGQPTPRNIPPSEIRV